MEHGSYLLTELKSVYLDWIPRCQVPVLLFINFIIWYESPPLYEIIFYNYFVYILQTIIYSMSYVRQKVGIARPSQQVLLILCVNSQLFLE